MAINVGIWPKPFFKPGYDQNIKPYRYHVPIITKNFSPNSVDVDFVLEGMKSDNTWETIHSETLSIPGTAIGHVIVTFQKPADQWDYTKLRITATRQDTSESDTDEVVVEDLINYYTNPDNIVLILNYLFDVKVHDGSSWVTLDPGFVINNSVSNPYATRTVTFNYTFNPNGVYTVRIIPKQDKILEWIEWQNQNGYGNYAYYPIELYFYLQCLAQPSATGGVTYGVRVWKEETASTPAIKDTEGIYASAKTTTISDRIVEVTVLSGPYSNYDKSQDPYSAEDGDVVIYPELFIQMPDVNVDFGIIKVRVRDDFNQYLHNKITGLGND